MIDARFDFKNNQKKQLSVYATGDMTVPAMVKDEILMFTLPPESLVVRIHMVVTTATGDAADKFDLTIAGTSVGTIGMENKTTGTITQLAPFYFPTGGEVKLIPDAALTADVGGRLVIEYIELSLTDGTYTD